MFKFADLFAGIGGFRLAFEQAGYQCVSSCEINPACQEVYFNNFGDFPEVDITKIEIKNLPDFDVLTAGFPCQPFSICGKRKGFQDTRGTLFFSICEIIEAKNPSVILLENVKHLLHQDKGKTLKVILYSLEDLGYFVSLKVINAKDFGLPQNRERVIIIATKKQKFDFERIRIDSQIYPLREFLCQSGKFEYLNPTEYTMIENPKQQRSGLIFVGYRNKSIWKKGIRPNTEHLSRVHHQPNRIYSIDGVHPTIPSQETSGRFFIHIPEENSVRKLTLKECYRIMGFPDHFITHKNVSECYKQVGNSVCIPMMYEIALQLREQILENEFNHNSSANITTASISQKSSPIQLAIPGLQAMEHKNKLIEIYNRSISIDKIQQEIPIQYINFINVIAKKCTRQKAVYTVFITLVVHKILYPKQDIRYHQSNMQGGFSGRTIDTKEVTPTLQELGLPAMAESGWLTRSLEQPYPYTLDYNGKISDRAVKEAFLNLIDFVQNNGDRAEIVLQMLLHESRKIVEANKVEIVRIENAEKLDIKTIINCLKKHFNYNYKTHGASKLPVLAFYAIYELIIEEISRYEECRLKPLGSHTASDRTSKSAGDIEIYDRDDQLIEVIEIKHGKAIDLQMIRIAKDKIIKFNPQRYCIYSSADIQESEKEQIENEIEQVRETHGCQIIINGVLPTLKYYLRLVMSLQQFVDGYSQLVEVDTELQKIHKEQWNKILTLTLKL
ncbi:DNA cytosine methyltransferase [Spirulina sp. 06S082]|uniref:DNA cytosine methyltransferase n=1 Tax=Spirulina sp. 06S082 TaxID=3110248 RepID=UPI003A4DB56D